MQGRGNGQGRIWLLSGTGEGPPLAAALLRIGWRGGGGGGDPPPPPPPPLAPATPAERHYPSFSDALAI